MRLDLDKRYIISAHIQAGFLQKDIAKRIGISTSTISRELACNGGLSNYDPVMAQNLQNRYQVD